MTLTHIRTMMYLGPAKLRGHETAFYQVMDVERRFTFAYVWYERFFFGFDTLADAKEAFRLRATGGEAVETDEWQEEIDNVV